MLGIHRMLLHAERLSFPHPRTGTPMAVEAPPDVEFGKALALFADA
jgi:tRNA pseudouridine65 synthase